MYMNHEIEDHINLISDLADNLIILALCLSTADFCLSQSIVCPAINSVAECIKKEASAVMDMLY